MAVQVDDGEKLGGVLAEGASQRIGARVESQLQLGDAIAKDLILPRELILHWTIETISAASGPAIALARRSCWRFSSRATERPICNSEEQNQRAYGGGKKAYLRGMRWRPNFRAAVARIERRRTSSVDARRSARK